MGYLDCVIANHEEELEKIEEAKQHKAEISVQISRKKQSVITNLITDIIEPAFLFAQQSLFENGYSTGIDKTERKSKVTNTEYVTAICFHLCPVKLPKVAKKIQNANNLTFSANEDETKIKVNVSNAINMKNSRTYPFEELNTEFVEEKLADFITDALKTYRKSKA